MCGRVVQARPLDVLAELLEATPTPLLAGSYKPAWNIPPTQPVVGLTPGLRGPNAVERILDLYSWGLRGRFFNARAETVATNATFAPALGERRLAVLVDGFYEWQGTPRRPLFFQRADGAPLALAGLWDPWRGDGGIEAACTIITTAAGPDLDGVHDRQPVLLGPDGLASWLAPGPLAGDVLAGLLAPGPGGALTRHPVDPRVGDVRNDGPDLVAPYTEPEPLRLFG
ncbi:MAG: SOS response-associated peptidase [Acidimicrobiales bacterium]